MNNSINNSTDSLSDIVGINTIIEPSSTSPFMVILLTIVISIAVSYFYYQIMHGFKGQLRHIKYQLKHKQLLPRDAAHKIAALSPNKPLTDARNDTLKKLRFSSTLPSINQIIEFIDHVE